MFDWMPSKGQSCKRRLLSLGVQLSVISVAVVFGNAASLASDNRSASQADHAHSKSGTRNCPEGSVAITPGGPSAQTVIDSNDPGTSFCFRSGIHRTERPLQPEDGDSFYFSPDAVLDGSKVVTNWEREGEYWISDGQNQSFLMPDPVPCENNAAACEYEDLFWDGRPLQRVLTKEELGSGRFYFDEVKHHMYLVDNPSGHVVEAVVTAIAFDGGSAKDVKIANGVIQKFGLFGIVAGQNWTIVDNDISYCHSHGVRAFNGGSISRNLIHHNGNMGIFAYGGTFAFEGNELAFNNYLNFGKRTEAWHAGATKIWGTTSIVRKNWSHDNIGDGWWFDTDNVDNVIEDNVFENNTRFGLFYEISQKGVVRRNTFRRNQGGGLWVNTSKDLEVTGNVFDRNGGYTIGFVAESRGLSAKRGDAHEMAGLSVHHNEIRMIGGKVGIPYGIPAAYSAENWFYANRYLVSEPNAKAWVWRDSAKTWTEWRSVGQDKGSTLDRLPAG